MKVTYTLRGTAHELNTSESEDLREMAREIESQLHGEHDELQGDADLPVRIADGLLNSLSLNAEEIELLELQPTAS